MKRVITLLFLLSSLFTAQCGINKTLIKAQGLYQTAKTIEDYQKAKKQFELSDTDPGYEPSDNNAINDGINKCNNKINELSSNNKEAQRVNQGQLKKEPTKDVKFIINGQSEQVNLMFQEMGGSRRLAVEVSDGLVPYEVGIPSWLSVTESSSNSITLNCKPNQSREQRQGDFIIRAGNANINISVTQSGNAGSSGSSNDSGSSQSPSDSDSQKIYTTVSEQPQFPGGDRALMRWLSDNIKHPRNADGRIIHGGVDVEFIVETNGTVSNATVTYTENNVLNAEAVRLINSITGWIPAKVNGRPVRCQLCIQLDF